MRLSPIIPLLLVVTAGVSACDHNTDSVARLNAIPFGGTNDTNIALMAANPADLIRGRGQAVIDSKDAQSAIDREQTDKAKPLLNAGRTSNVGGAGG